MRKIAALGIAAITFCPALLSVVSALTGSRCDVRLNGFTDEAPKPAFSGKSFLDGEFQKQYAAWLDQNLKPKGVASKTFNTVKYYVFDLAGNSTEKGKGGAIFEKGVLLSAFGLEDYDYSSREKRGEMRRFVETLTEVQGKLARVGKHLYVYVPGSKVTAMRDAVPWKYAYAGGHGNRYGIVDCFREQISATGIKTFFADDIIPSLEYPAFYKSGTHWSRTYEQIVSNHVIDDLCELTGRKYRKIALLGVEASKKPFWRENDILSLVNVWADSGETYYQYGTAREMPLQYDKLRVLLQGDSYGEGIRKDILDTYPYDKLFYVNYDNLVSDNHWRNTLLNHSWDNFDWQYHLDNVDVVVVEICEQNLVSYSCGFAQHLNEFLDRYVPGGAAGHTARLDVRDLGQWSRASCEGVYEHEGKFAWAKPYCEVILRNAEIANGLEIDFIFPNQLKQRKKTVTVYVNGTLAKQHEASVGANRIDIDKSDIPAATNDVYDVEIYCASYFNPSREGMSADNRDLAIQLKYVGEVR